jgi:hypothetical protein
MEERVPTAAGIVAEVERVYGAILRESLPDGSKPLDPATTTWGDMLALLAQEMLKRPGATYAMSFEPARDASGAPIPGTRRNVLTIVADLPDQR